MRNQLALFSILLVAIVLVGLLALSGSLLIVASPVLLYLAAAYLSLPDARITVRRRLGANRVLPGTRVVVTVTVRCDDAALPEVLITDAVPPGLEIVSGSPSASIVLRPGVEFSFTYTVTAQRGSFEFDVVTVSAAGDFPLRSRSWQFHAPAELVTLPHHGALSRIPIAPRRTLVYAGTLPSRRGGDGTEFFDVRLHDGRSEPRHVNWRLTARRPGEVYVTEFQEERVADIGIILDARLGAYPKTAGRSLVEYSAVAAASLTEVLIDQGNRVGYLAYGVSLDWTAPGFGKIQKQRILTRIAQMVPGDSYVFSRLDQIPDRLLPAGSQLIVVSPLTAGDAEPIIRLAMLRYVVLVVSPNPVAYQAEEASPNSPAGMARRINRAQRLVLIRRLNHAGVPVIDWDVSVAFDVAVSRSLGRIQAAWRRRRG